MFHTNFVKQCFFFAFFAMNYSSSKSYQKERIAATLASKLFAVMIKPERDKDAPCLEFVSIIVLLY
jgi:hypothetical protein